MSESTMQGNCRNPTGDCEETEPVALGSQTSNEAGANPGSEAKVEPGTEGAGGRCNCGCGSGQTSQLVYVIGQLSYDFGTEARLDSILQSIGGDLNPQNPAQLLDHLDRNPADAADIIFTLAIDTTPMYSIRPAGAFGSHAYEALRGVLRSQLTEGADRVSIAGWIVGSDRLMNGQVIPRIHPVVRGIWCWSTKALVDSVLGQAGKDAKNSQKVQEESIANFLERVYEEFRNPGLQPHHRALNYAATNAFNVAKIFESALKDQLELDKIVMERSPISRPNSDCWDMKLVFFDPRNMLGRARLVYKFSVNVVEAVPSMVGRVRSWSVR